MPDAQRAVWKEKAGLPHGLGDLVRSRLKEANLDFMTYGELFAAIDQMLIERCTQKKVENAERKELLFLEIGKGICHQFRIDPYFNNNKKIPASKVSSKTEQGRVRKEVKQET